MDIISSESGIYTLSFSKGELPDGRLTKKRVKDLICRALNVCRLPENSVAELYENGEKVLIFAHIPPTFYSFENFEAVITACTECRPTHSSLYFYDGAYILSVPFPIPVMEEFAQCFSAFSEYELFLKEHGTLISDDAVNFVKNTF